MAVATFGMRCAFHLLQPIMGRKALQHEKRRRFLKNVDDAARREREKTTRSGREREKTTRSGGGAFVPHGSDGDKRRGHDRRKTGRGVSGPWQGSRRRPASGLRFPPSSLASGLSPRLFPPSRSARAKGRGFGSFPRRLLAVPLCRFPASPARRGGKGRGVTSWIRLRFLKTWASSESSGRRRPCP